MAISNIVCRGYGSFGGGVNKVPTRGYSSGAVVVVVANNTPVFRTYRVPKQDRVYEVPKTGGD